MPLLSKSITRQLQQPEMQPWVKAANFPQNHPEPSQTNLVGIVSQKELPQPHRLMSTAVYKCRIPDFPKDPSDLY